MIGWPTPPPAFIDVRATEHERRVAPAEPERIRERDPRAHVPRLVRDVIERALRIRPLEVDRRRQDAGLERADAQQRLERPGRAEQVTRHRLRGGHRDAIDVRPEDRADRARLGGIARRACWSRARSDNRRRPARARHRRARAACSAARPRRPRSGSPRGRRRRWSRSRARWPRIVAPRARACSSSSSTSTAAPSPITKPSRSRSKGRLAAAGASLRVESARIAPKPASATCVAAASLPPASITSASPRSISRADSPIEWAPEVHALTWQRFGPRRPLRIAT